MHLNHRLTLWLFLLVPFFSFSQSEKTTKVDLLLDSLAQSLSDSTITLDAYEIFYENVFSFAARQPGHTIEIATQFIDHAERLNYLKGQADMYSHIGNIYRTSGLEENAIENHILATEIFHDIKEMGSYVYGLINVGNIFFDIERYDEAETYYRKAINVTSEDFDLTGAKAVAYNNLGLISEERNQKSEAREYYEIALEIRKRMENPELIGHSYEQFGALNLNFGAYDSALFYFKTSFKYARQIEDSLRQYERFWNLHYLMAETFMELNQFEHSLAHLDSAIHLARIAGFVNYEARSCLLASKIFAEIGNSEKALEKVTESYELANRYELWELKSQILNELIDQSLKRNDYQSAFLHQSELIELYDFLDKEASTVEVTSKRYEAELNKLEQEARDANELRNLQTESLRKNKQINTVLYMSLGAFLVFLIILGYLLAQAKKKREQAGLDNDLIRSQKEEIQRTNQKLQKSNELLEESLSEKSNFMSKMSHEIRTPMNAIGGLTEILLQYDLNADQEQLVRNINHSSMRLTSLVDDILDYSRLESGRVALSESNFKLHELVNDIAALNQKKAEHNGTLIHLRIAPSLPDVLYGDAARLQQILNNLISNAVKFTENGHIHVRIMEDEVSKDGYRVGFEVEDTGIGIGKEHLESIFDEFHQGNVDIHARFGGTGLGLAICRQLVQLMGGAISVQSTPGKGSTFAFHLPLKRAVKEEPVVEKQNVSLEKRKLLLVEDDKMNQFVAQRILKPTGIEVTIANNGEEAIALCKEYSFDILLMDLQMPVLDGLQATREIRKIKTYKDTPIIALTADVQSETKKAAFDVGMNALVTKPFQGKELISAISELLPPL